MAIPEHLAKLKLGVASWNQWREKRPDARPELKEANLVKANLIKADLHGVNLYRTILIDADLRGANLCGANLHRAYLRGADLREANLIGTDLTWVDLKRADLRGAILTRANLSGSDLAEACLDGADLKRATLDESNLSWAQFASADLTGASLMRANLVQANFDKANLTSCKVYGVSAWDVRLEGAIQSNLVITPLGESVIEVDSLEVAQFVYLLLNNKRIRHGIDTITSKVVLILGRFTPERKAVLDAIREELRKRDYLPILFDFQKPDSKDLTGTVMTLANMARFIIADLTDPGSIPYELGRIVPNTKVPVQAIILDDRREFAMFNDLLDYRWVLPPYRYQSEETLLASLNERVIAPAEAKVIELRRK